MDPTSPRWKEITRSEFPWECAALDYVRENLPDHEPYRAWSNFEFIADDGSVNEVDLLVLTPKGFFLVEIKSRPGAVTGDAGTWSWAHDGRVYTVDNPYLLANKKAKKLISLLKRQESSRRAHARLPFLQAKIFLSAEDIDIRLDPHVRQSVHHRDRPTESKAPDRDGILYALWKWEREDPPRFRVDRPIAKVLSRAMDEAGIRHSQRARAVGDYRLGELLYDGPGYQDWDAKHVALDNVVRRVRIYSVASEHGATSRETVLRAARREFEILQGITHPGILKAVDYKEHGLGPALVFEHDPSAVRLDHFLRHHVQNLDAQQRLNLIRQIAEAVQFAHEKRLVHRALSPQSILVLNASTDPQIQIFNWQTGARSSGSSSGASVSGTVHVDQLVENPAGAYMAPEALFERGSSDEEMDVFSLGAIAFHIFSGQAPASNFHELTEKIREGHGLQISSILDGAGEELQNLIRASTYGETTGRIPSVSEFLKGLDEVEAELSRPDTDEGYVPDPTRATKGDRLEHGFIVKQRLGKGASAVGLLVERDGVSQVLKVALTPEANERLENEAEVLKKLRHQYIVELHDELDFDGRVGLLMAQATEGTLAERLRDEGRLQLELLERFGEDLLQAVEWLDQQGIPHRDIKPENIGVTRVGKNKILHLVLFDFSLARTPPENIRAGTIPYLDPFLSLRKPPRWDTHAERFAAAMTLCQMTTGTLPIWGDAQSNPAVLDCEATIDAASFDPAFRDTMTAFFAKALRRNYRDRFDNAHEMLQAWRQIFREAEKKPEQAKPAPEVEEMLSLDQVKLSTPLALIGLSTRALNVLERLDALIVRDFLRLSMMNLLSMRGVGSETRRDLSDFSKRLRSSFPDVERDPLKAPPTETATPEEESRSLSVDLLAEKLVSKKIAAIDAKILRQLLCLEDGDPNLVKLWPSQSDVARKLNLPSADVGAILRVVRKRWSKTPALTHLAEDVCRILDAHGGVMTTTELAEGVLSARGSAHDDPRRMHFAMASVRAAVEAERERAESRFIVRRPHTGTHVLVARDEIDRSGDTLLDGQKLADYAQALAAQADELVSDDVPPSPARVEEALGQVTVPPGVSPLSPSRRLQLAAAASAFAAVSSRLELYKRGMPAAISLRLAQGALAGAKELTHEQIQARVQGRYPHARPLPERPELDAVLSEIGSELTWDPEAASGSGAYVAARREFTTVSSRTSFGASAPPTPAFQELTPEETDARLFEERLQHAAEDGAFLALVVAVPGARRALARLRESFDVEIKSFDALLIQRMKAIAEEKKADWSVVLRADRTRRGSSDWGNLLRVVRLALQQVREELAAAKSTVLLTNAGLLARYDQLQFLDEIRDSAGSPGGPPGVWLLIPGDSQQEKPMIDGVPVPVFTRAQWARIPDTWLRREKEA